jgi:N-acetylmuramoyl-L-alanine amidase
MRVVLLVRRGALVRWAALVLFVAAFLSGTWAGYHALLTARASAVVAFLPGRTVVIDPGHGGRDPGASGRVRGVIEKDVTLAISLRLRDLLRGAGATVMLVRDRDVDLGLTYPGPGDLKQREFLNRAGIIKRSGADVLVSIHCNAYPSSVWRGAQTFYDSGGDPACARLAQLIQQELVRLTPTDREASPRIKHYVLRHATMPAATVEVGFLTNPDDERLLGDQAHQQKVAWAIFLGLARFFAAFPPLAPALPAAGT